MEKGKENLLSIIFIIVIVLFLILSLKNLNITGNSVSDLEEHEEFNLRIEIPSEYKNIKEGDKIWFTVKILNLANKERVDIQLVYNIKDQNKKTIASRKETVAIETQASFVGNIEIPKSTEKGSYVLEVQMISANGDISEGQTSFNITPKRDLILIIKENYIYIIVIAVILIIIIVLIKLKPKIKKIAEKRMIKSKIKDLIRRKIKNEKVTLEDLEQSKLPKQKKIVDDSKDKKYY